MHLRYNKSMPDIVEHRKNIYYNYIFLSYSVYGDGANKLIDSEKTRGGAEIGLTATTVLRKAHMIFF
jgi:hypothetical protein